MKCLGLVLDWITVRGMILHQGDQNEAINCVKRNIELVSQTLINTIHGRACATKRLECKVLVFKVKHQGET